MVYAESKGENREHPTKRRVSLYYPYSIRIVGEGWLKGTRINGKG